MSGTRYGHVMERARSWPEVILDSPGKTAWKDNRKALQILRG